MEIAQSVAHPLLFFAAQILSTALVVAYSSSSSIIRPMVLPLVCLSTWWIICDAQQYMRLHWASLLSGSSVGFSLQYVEIVLLSRWSFESKSRTVANPGDLETEHEKHQVQHATCMDKLRFGLFSTFSFRNINTAYEVKNVPEFPGHRIPSKPKFLLSQTFTMAYCILIVDVSTAQPRTPETASLFSPDKVQFFSRLAVVSKEETLARILTSVMYWLNMYAIMQGVTSAASIVAVGLGLSEVRAWRPLFGNFTAARDLRGFWGYVHPLHLCKAH
jgi:hypothetical protein